MGNLWLKFRIWTKVAAFAFLLIYALIFVSFNYSSRAEVWLWFGTPAKPRVLALVFFTFLFGVVGTILVRTTLRTLSQIKDLRARGRAEKIERQVALMQAKAQRLQTKGEPSAINPPVDGV